MKVISSGEATMTLSTKDEITNEEYQFFVNWDGCTEITFMKSGDNIHLCGGVSQLRRDLDKVEALAKEHFGGWPG